MDKYNYFIQVNRPVWKLINYKISFTEIMKRGTTGCRTLNVYYLMKWTERGEVHSKKDKIAQK